MLKVKNNLTNTLENFEPINKNKISMYVCGPTVYGDIHIGNARSAITFDIIYRYLKNIGYDVFYLHNITDIDDKIINKAIELNEPELKLSNNFYLKYLDILESLNILRPNKLVKISENIDIIINFIKSLLESNHAYLTNDGIYFDTTKINNYGKILSNQKIEKLSQSEKNDATYKNNPLDFALWKFTKIGINWDFPEGKKGRPGWHTECVAIINHYLGPLIDIHGGGSDLIFPHHENEICQQVAFKNTYLAKYWLHNGHLKINDLKMSKSLNNTILVKDFLKNYDANMLRYIFLSTNYRNAMNVSESLIQQSKINIFEIYGIMAAFSYEINLKKFIDNFYINDFHEQMKNNFNLPNVLTITQKIIKIINFSIRDKKSNITEISKNANALYKIFTILGFNFDFLLQNLEICKLSKNLCKSWNVFDIKTRLNKYNEVINLVKFEIK